MDDVWVNVPKPASSAFDSSESMPDRVRRVERDLRDLNTYYNISIAPRRHARLRAFFADELESLHAVAFDALGQQDRVDFLLLRNFLRRSARQLDLEVAALDLTRPVLPFAPLLVKICEARQDVEPIGAETVAQMLDDARQSILDVKTRVDRGKVSVKDTLTGLKAAAVIEQLRARLDEFFHFYAGYDPLFDWWATRPWQDVDAALADYLPLVRTRLAGMHPDRPDEIVGEPIGREALLVELEAEMIAYSPEDLIRLANREFAWCERQMKTAARDLGFGDDWRAAMEDVKERFVPPGEQPRMVMDLALEGADFVKKHDLVTVPPISEETYPMYMMGAAQQKVSPFFLGGPAIQVAYPTPSMPHQLKRMVMRGNNPHFSRATAFHELIPGHRLQLFVGGRSNAHRAALFSSSFFVEGWAMYWEFAFWARGDFFVSAADRVGTLFWRMHRCARIILSLRFHLGEATPQECVDVLVGWVGHERSTAESEVHRWFGGEYAPLYQAGYMLGALQLVALRGEVVDGGGQGAAAAAATTMGEKAFHDAVLRANTMPIELLRALLLGLELTPDYKPQWKFYDFHGQVCEG